MATQYVSDTAEPRSSAWGELIFAPHKRYHSHRKARQPSWNALRSIDVVTVCEDPRHWKSLTARSMRGETQAFKRLLEEFSVCLEMFFVRAMTDDQSDAAIGQTLQSVADKLHTCDTSRPILPWLLAIAKYRAEHPSGPNASVPAMKH
ncbi:hypothetical protein [uncultured Erythrobacter sp.]|uniref:hypothetical protein n=1 Tax=uncultured Erythrobacter sp. TaxID=263913 RepID=UPI0026164F78|nr:hypothetical protein [uncultured Erythrobacter sp.]